MPRAAKSSSSRREAELSIRSKYPKGIDRTKDLTVERSRVSDRAFATACKDRACSNIGLVRNAFIGVPWNNEVELRVIGVCLSMFGVVVAFLLPPGSVFRLYDNEMRATPHFDICVRFFDFIKEVRLSGLQDSRKSVSQLRAVVGLLERESRAYRERVPLTRRYQSHSFSDRS